MLERGEFKVSSMLYPLELVELFFNGFPESVSLACKNGGED